MDIAGCEGGGFLEDLPSDRVLVSASSQQTQKSYEYPQWHASVWTGLVFQIGTHSWLLTPITTGASPWARRCGTRPTTRRWSP